MSFMDEGWDPPFSSLAGNALITSNTLGPNTQGTSTPGFDAFFEGLDTRGLASAVNTFSAPLDSQHPTRTHADSLAVAVPQPKSSGTLGGLDDPFASHVAYTPIIPSFASHLSPNMAPASLPRPDNTPTTPMSSASTAATSPVVGRKRPRQTCTPEYFADHWSELSSPSPPLPRMPTDDAASASCEEPLVAEPTTPPPQGCRGRAVKSAMPVVCVTRHDLDAAAKEYDGFVARAPAMQQQPHASMPLPEEGMVRERGAWVAYLKQLQHQSCHAKWADRMLHIVERFPTAFDGAMLPECVGEEAPAPSMLGIARLAYESSRGSSGLKCASIGRTLKRKLLRSVATTHKRGSEWLCYSPMPDPAREWARLDVRRSEKAARRRKQRLVRRLAKIEQRKVNQAGTRERDSCT